MNRVAKRTSTCGGIALWAFGCSSLPADATYPASPSDAANPIVTTDSAVSTPPVPDAVLPIADVVDASAADVADASAADVVDASAPDAETPCNQTGAAACDGALAAMCQRFGQCCQAIGSCEPWATDLSRCKAHFIESGVNCASPEFSEMVCESVTAKCQGDIPLVACSDLAFGTANWPSSCRTFWKQFGSDTIGVGSAVTLVAENGKCMDVRHAGTANETKIQIWQCNGTRAQSFRFEQAPNGAVRLVNTNSNKCVDVRHAGKDDGIPIQLWDCNGTEAQTFTVRRSGSFFNLVNTNSDKCLDIQWNGSADGTPVQLWTCNGTSAQLFRARWNDTTADGGTPPNRP
jgi:hypothetical protein